MNIIREVHLSIHEMICSDIRSIRDRADSILNDLEQCDGTEAEMLKAELENLKGDCNVMETRTESIEQRLKKLVRERNTETFSPKTE